jgi:tRNA nucleotidyltransferase/poly(A) polymerase
MRELAPRHVLLETLAPLRAALAEAGEVWVVGGAVRDALLGRPVLDFDVVVRGDPERLARAYARASGGAPFALSDRHGAWRVVDGERTLDVTAVATTLPADLARRDFTVDAIAVRLHDGALVDPLDGVADLAAGVLRPVSDHVFVDDPLRLLRLVRLASELDLVPTPEAERLARRDAALAAHAAGERQLAELLRLLAAPDPVDGILALEGLGVLGALLPEVAALRGVVQNPYHHLDVLDHTLHVVDAVADVAAHVGHYLAPAAVAAVEAELAASIDGAVDVRLGLRLAALVHDVAKPETRTVTADGSIKFFGHEERGAELTHAIARRLHASRALERFLDVLVRHHLALGFLVKRRPLTPRAAYRYAVATAPYPYTAVVLSLGDRLATRGVKSRLRGVRRHVELASEMALALQRLGPLPPPALLPADELARRAGIATGPLLGALVAALREEQAAGEVTTADEAVAFARSFAERS